MHVGLQLQLITKLLTINKTSWEALTYSMQLFVQWYKGFLKYKAKIRRRFKYVSEHFK